jgi:hypothetical protein
VLRDAIHTQTSTTPSQDPNDRDHAHVCASGEKSCNQTRPCEVVLYYLVLQDAIHTLTPSTPRQAPNDLHHDIVLCVCVFRTRSCASTQLWGAMGPSTLRQCTRPPCAPPRPPRPLPLIATIASHTQTLAGPARPQMHAQTQAQAQLRPT